jgi:hypothetical protein
MHRFAMLLKVRANWGHQTIKKEPGTAGLFLSDGIGYHRKCTKVVRGLNGAQQHQNKNQTDRRAQQPQKNRHGLCSLFVREITAEMHSGSIPDIGSDQT